jgi:WD40 repeat protein
VSRIFISHATADNAKTRAIIAWIVSQGWPREEIFVDFDDIGGGQRWREALTKAASRCEAVVFLISPEWVRRPWCTGEAGAAQMLGKQIIPVLIEPTPPDTYRDLLTVEYQLIDLTVPGPRCVIDVLMPDTGQTLPVALAESGLQRLVVGLKRAGLDPSTFPLTPGRKIYPGLAPLDTDDAAVFFGRDADIARGIETLRQMRERGQSLLAILAASGAGKSSFLRAGLWPRLQRSDREFLILPVLRPGVDALNGEQGLVAGLHRAAETLGLKRNLADWRAQIESGDFAGALSVLHTAARTGMLAVDAPQPASASQTPPSQRHASLPPIPVLPIDQAEELFGAQGGEPAWRLLDLLGAALREGQLIAVLAIRSDRYGDLQTAQALAGLEQRPFSLPPIADGVLKDVIEGPAQRDRAEHGANGLSIDPQLTDRLLRDWADADGLPLLAFTLRRLLDDYGSDGRLNLEDYERSGQLQGALEAAITRAMQAATAAGSLPEDAQAREALIRSSFVPWLVSIDPQSQQAQRRIAKRNALPAASQDLIGRLIDARLLTCDRPQDSDASVEVAHEAILRHWPLLDRIIGQEREALIVLNEVKRDAEGWQASKKSEDALESEDALLHRGDRLHLAEQHLVREDFQSALGDDGRRYLAACRAREANEIEDRRIQQEREEAQISKTRKLQRRATVFLAVVVTVIVIAGVFLMRVQKTTNQASADVLASLASQAFDRLEYDRAVRFALAGVRKSDVTLQAIDTSKADIQLQRAGYRSSLRAILKYEEDVRSVGISPDGRRFLTVSGNFARLWDAASGKILTTMQHDGSVLGAAFSADGRRIVTTSRDYTTRLWETGSETPLATMRDDELYDSVALSADGRYIVTVSGYAAHLWEAGAVTALATMRHEGTVRSAAFSSDGRHIVTASWDDTARLWQTGSEKPLATMRHGLRVHSAAFSPDGRRIVTASDENTVRLWETGDETPVATLRHDNSVLGAAFSPDGRRIVTASYDRTARLWDADSGQTLATMWNDQPVFSAAFSADGRRIVTASVDNTARLWEAGSETPLATIRHDETVNGIAISTDGRRMVTASGNNTRFWEISAVTPLATMRHDREVIGAALSADGHRIVTASSDNTARIWEAGSETPLATMRLNRKIISAAISAHGRRIVTASSDNTARLWEAGTETALATMRHDGDGWVVSTAFSPDGHRIVTASWDKTARLWEAGSETPLATMQHDGEVVSAAFSPDGSRIVTASSDKTARLWEAGSETPLATMQHDGEVVSAAFSPDGRRIVTASSDRTARLWEAGSVTPLATMQHGGVVVSAAFSPDGRHIVTAADYSAHLWKPGAVKALTTMRHDEAVVSAAFSADGLRIVTASGNTARLWEAGAETPLATMRHDGDVISASFSADGRRIVTASDDGTARLWDTGFFLLDGQKLIDTICRDILNIDINAPPRENDLSRLTDEELQMAAVIDPNTERDVCRPPTRWQRLANMFGIGG